MSFNSNQESIFTNTVNELRLHLETFDAKNTEHWSRLDALVHSFLIAEYQKLPMNFLDTIELRDALNRIDASLTKLLKNLGEMRFDPLNDDVAKLNSLNVELNTLNSEIKSVQGELNSLNAVIKLMQEELKGTMDVSEKLAKYMEKDEIALKISQKEKEIAQKEKEIAQKEKEIALEIALEIANREKAMREKILEHRLQISNQKTAIVVHSTSLSNGTFFSAIGDVWIAEEKSFGEAKNENTTFNRTTHVTNIFLNQEDQRYEDTAEGAYNSIHDVAEDSSRASSKHCAASDGITQIDIFGVSNGQSHPAHLMPHSENCSRFWFSIVPCVLNLSTTNHQTPSWKVLQKCIHGFFVKKDANSTSMNETATDKKNNAVTTADKFGNRSDKRVNLVGIKHFPTNLIWLQHKEEHLDNNPRLLIVPIMTVEQAKNWNGGCYFAIVLAGPCDDNTTSEKVYADIRAFDGGAFVGIDYLASMDDLEKARSLLETMVLSVTQSLKFHYCNESSALKTELRDAVEKMPESLKVEVAAFKTLEDLEKITVPVPKPVPKLTQDEEIDEMESGLAKECSHRIESNPEKQGSEFKTNVRKIFFSDRCSEDTLTKFHAAPDPVLLLAKAASNWLKRQDFGLLPEFGSNLDDDEASHNLMTIEEEYAARGWCFDKRPRFTEIDLDCSITGNRLDDESLSGSETDFGVK